MNGYDANLTCEATTAGRTLRTSSTFGDEHVRDGDTILIQEVADDHVRRGGGEETHEWELPVLENRRIDIFVAACERAYHFNVGKHDGIRATIAMNLRTHGPWPHGSRLDPMQRQGPQLRDHVQRNRGELR